MTEHVAFPLDWPPGWPVTKSYNRMRGHFTTNLCKARDELLEEIRKLGAINPVISSNIPVRRDGLPYADFRSRDIENPGVAIYFQWDGKPYAIACDKYLSVHDNMRAVGLSIASIRALERYGASTIMERAFSGFAALPAPMAMGRDWTSVFEIKDDRENWTAKDVENRFKELAMERHPDRGGSAEQMDELLKAREEALREVAS